MYSPTNNMYHNMFNLYDTTYPSGYPSMSTIPACINPYFASYDQDLLSPAFSKRGLSSQDHRAPSQFVPTSSHADTMPMSIAPTNQTSQMAPQQPAAATYTPPKHVLHVGDDKPMAREDRVARCPSSATSYYAYNAVLHSATLNMYTLLQHSACYKVLIASVVCMQQASCMAHDVSHA